MDYFAYIDGWALSLIPALYITGRVVQRSGIVKDKYIPLVLTICGVAASMWQLGPVPEALIQGILVTGAAVLGDQTGKQLKKGE